jgi:hypothetical protein
MILGADICEYLDKQLEEQGFGGQPRNPGVSAV